LSAARPAGDGTQLRMTRIMQMKNVQADFVRFTAAIALGLLGAAMAAPVRPAAAQTTREACTHDAFRLCSDAIPDVEKTKACLARNRDSLSPACKAAFGGGAPHRHRRHRRRGRGADRRTDTCDDPQLCYN
jgi:hypothetical protein